MARSWAATASAQNPRMRIQNRTAVIALLIIHRVQGAEVNRRDAHASGTISANFILLVGSKNRQEICATANLFDLRARRFANLTPLRSPVVSSSDPVPQ